MNVAETGVRGRTGRGSPLRGRQGPPPRLLLVFANVLVVVLAVVALALSLPGVASAQALRLNDATYADFSRRDGVPDEPLYSLSRSASGVLWLGTHDGPRHYTGSGWNAVPLPADVRERVVRAILEDDRGDIYYVHNFGISHSREGREWTPSVLIDSAAAPIYSAVLDRLPDGRWSVLLGAKGGLFRWAGGQRLERVALPAPMKPAAVMLAKRAGDPSDEVWFGSQGGGVARRRDGVWRVWGTKDGLTDLQVEHVAPAPRGDSVEAIAATNSGAFVLVGDRWRPTGPRTRATRALRVRVGDQWETWVGSITGEVMRARDGGPWEPVDVGTRGRGSRVQILEAIDHGLAEPTIYTGFRSGALLRFRVGVAGRLVAPSEHVGHRISRIAPSTAGDGYWAWMAGYGAVRLPRYADHPADSAMMPYADGPAYLLDGSRTAGAPLLAAVGSGVFRLRSEGWQRALSLGSNDPMRALVRLPTPRGEWAPVAVTAQGAWIEQASGAFERWPGFPLDVRIAVPESLGNSTSVLVATRSGVVQRLVDDRWVVVGAAEPMLRAPPVAGLSWRYPSGERALVLATGEGLALLRVADGVPAWRFVRREGQLGLHSDDVRDLAPLADGRLAAATARGLVVFALGASFDDSVRTLASYSDADGLPHASVTAIGSVDDEGRLWVGTDLGIGFVNLGAADRDGGPLTGVNLLLRDGDGRLLRTGAKVGSGARRLDVDVYASTYHREHDTVFRLELDGVPVASGGWSDRREHSLLALSPGRHVLSAWAADWRGLQAGPITRVIDIAAPWWRSWPALALYVIAFALVAWTVDRVRVGSARRRAQEAESNERRLATSEARFRRLFEGGANAQLLVLDGRIWQANAAALTLLQCGGEAPLVERGVEELLPGLGAALAEGAEPGEGRELVATNARGEAIPVEVRRTRIPLEGTVIDHLELRDLRERRRLQEERRVLETQLRESQRLESLGTLAGGVAHDFNNLLTVIHANAELAALDVDERSEAGESLRHLMVASRRARDVVRQILTFSRHAPSRREIVSVDMLLAELQSMLRSTIPSTVQLQLENDAPGARVAGDPTQLQQMLLNLCTNAEYAMRAGNGGVLTVQVAWMDGAAAEGGRELAMRVRDTGSGMTPEVRARIFEPFFTTKPVGEGTGLGMSVLHGIVGAHGGTVSVESTVGVGTTVEIRLPTVADPIDAGTGSGVEPSGGAPVRRGRILLVDDESAVAAALERLLQREGYEVHVVHDGAQALDRLRRGAAVDLLITDQTMPQMTGTQLAGHVRAHDADLPIIIASGYGGVLRDEEFRSLRAVRLDKPFSASQLLEVVEQALSNPSVLVRDA